jgi:hypothetical protein
MSMTVKLNTSLKRSRIQGKDYKDSVAGNFECGFYTFIRPNHHQLRKMQLYYMPSAVVAKLL